MNLEEELRTRLAHRAEGVDLTSDLADLEARIDRSARHRDAVRNGLALGGATVIVIVVVLFATVLTRTGPRLVNATTPSSTTTTSTVPVGEDQTRARVAADFATVFQPGAPDALRVAAIDPPDGIAAVIADIRRKAPPGTIDTVRVHVDRVVITSPDAAVVDFTITSTDPVHFPGKQVRTGGAVYMHGRWRMTRATFCDTVALLGEHCPTAGRALAP